MSRATGRFVLRVSRSLHRRLAVTAIREGVSVEELVAMYLAHYVGARQATDSWPPMITASTADAPTLIVREIMP